MFNFFKRAAILRAKPGPRQAVARSSASLVPAEPAPLPQVLEGNEESDWAMWEDSVAFLDSQMHPLAASETVYLREEGRPSQFQDIDPFSSIGKRHG